MGKDFIQNVNEITSNEGKDFLKGNNAENVVD